MTSFQPCTFLSTTSLAPSSDDVLVQNITLTEGAAPPATSTPPTTQEKGPTAPDDDDDDDDGSWRRAKVVCDYDATNRDEMSLMMNEVSDEDICFTPNTSEV